MPEQVNGATLFHVTVTKAYKTALVQGQHVTTGTGPNPFFGFYETARTYPVTDQNGNVQHVPAVAFLKLVRDGQIASTNLPNIAAEVTLHYVMLARELLMEQIRRAEFDDCPSRQTCLYCCATLEEAEAWRDRIGDPAMLICSLAVTGRMHRADASLLLADSEPLAETMVRAQRYWRGEHGDRPQLETLFSGEAVVEEVGL